MLHLIKKHSKTAGLIPGTLVHVGAESSQKVTISVIDYNESKCEERLIDDIKETFAYKDTKSVSWININGVHDTKMIEEVGKHFGLHPLLLEDIVNTGQRSKVEDFGDYLFIVAKMFYPGKNKDFESEQVSFVLGKNFVISFQEKEGDVFGQVRDRIKNSKGKIRTQGSDYLAYVLLDAIVDGYFIILENISSKIEGIEANLIKDPGPEVLSDIHSAKSEMIYLRKSLWPLREAVSTLERGESKLIDKKTSIYLRDVYDHTIQVIDTVEALRDAASSMLDIYLSSVSNKMNEVMKVLTIIATIFIPITFVAGIYGMNFNTELSIFNMPELNHPYGYLMVLGVMAVIALIMILYFKKKKWL